MNKEPKIIKHTDMISFMDGISKDEYVKIEVGYHEKCVFRHIGLDKGEELFMSSRKGYSIDYYTRLYGDGIEKIVDSVCVVLDPDGYLPNVSITRDQGTYHRNKILIYLILDDAKNENGDYLNKITLKGSWSSYNNFLGKMIRLDQACEKFMIMDKTFPLKGLLIESHSDFSFQGDKFSFNDKVSTIYALSYILQVTEINDYHGRSFSSERNITCSSLSRFFNKNRIQLNIPEKCPGITKMHKLIAPMLKEAYQTHAIGCIFYCYLAENSNKTRNSMKVSKLINTIFKSVKDRETLIEKLDFLESLIEDDKDYIPSYNLLEFLIEKCMLRNETLREMHKQQLKSNATGAVNKMIADLDFVLIDEKEFPKTHEAIFNGDIPLATIFSKDGESYHCINDNWMLWELMLDQHYEVTLELAKEVSSRTTYERDLMSYFYFVLYGLPNYLSKHTMKNWTCSPKHIKSENELDESKSSGGTVKKRSALTPIVDNENHHVIVPYVSMALSGYSTTYCYALDFNLLHQGMSFNGNVVTNELEEKLNGRDDYGLMFYTLTGSMQGRGYPTFLIIFERLDQGTVVHFHRVHPSRSKKGDYNPIHNWIKTCYKWMIGNVNYDNIVTQQGDLAFIKIEGITEEVQAQDAEQYEGHHFRDPVKVWINDDQKSNVLGTVLVEQDTELIHEEHMNRQLPKGYYELRQCRSWEANPKGVWSLRID